MSTLRRIWKLWVGELEEQAELRRSPIPGAHSPEDLAANDRLPTACYWDCPLHHGLGSPKPTVTVRSAEGRPPLVKGATAASEKLANALNRKPRQFYSGRVDRPLR